MSILLDFQVVPAGLEDFARYVNLQGGDPANCVNYRPISLLTMGYKLLATILLSRLKTGGAESRIWNSQFGFRSGVDTTDALFVMRRLFERK